MSILLTLIFHFFYVKIPYIFYGGIKKIEISRSGRDAVVSAKKESEFYVAP